MSVKPTLANARWADVGGANRLSPASGLRDTGFLNNTLAIPEYVNEELYQLYLWAQYLSDGDIDLDDVTANSLTLDSFLTVNGSATFNDPVVIDDASFGLTVLGPIGAGNITGSNLIATTDITAGNYIYQSGLLVHSIPACASKVLGSGVDAIHPLDGTTGGFRTATVNPNFIVYPITLPNSFATIKSYTLDVQKGSGVAMEARLYTINTTTWALTTVAGDSGASQAGTGNQTISNTGLNVSPPASLYLVVKMAASANFNSPDKIGPLTIIYNTEP